MTFTKDDKQLLKILVDKEIENVEKDAKQVHIDNSPFLNKLDDPDLPFLKSVELYHKQLRDLKSKL